MASLSLPADDARAPLRQPRGWLLLVIVAAAHVLPFLQRYVVTGILVGSVKG